MPIIQPAPQTQPSAQPQSEVVEEPQVVEEPETSAEVPSNANGLQNNPPSQTRASGQLYLWTTLLMFLNTNPCVGSGPYEALDEDMRGEGEPNHN